MRSAAQFLAVVAAATYVSAQASLYGQCGGQGWTGATTCSQGVCTYSNQYYSQCLPGSSTSTKSSSSVSSSSTTTSKSSSSLSTTTTTTKSTTTTSATSTTSPSSTPSTPVNISPEWSVAWAKAQAALPKLSLSNKVSLTTGLGWQNGPCVGNLAAISSIAFPELCLQDSPTGVRYADYVSAFNAEINVAATFNRTLMNSRGAAMGAEFKGKGVHVALGPMMNLARSPAAGRNWEGFGGDPYLSGEGAYQTVTGIQSAGVQACAKHFINNEQEHSRTTESSVVDDRTQHELYFAPFLRAVQANVASVMCSYNQINGSYSCQNDKMLNGVLKTEAAFAGYVMSDWSATMSGVPSVLAGLDQTMPGDITFNSGTTYFGQNLVNAVNQGQVPQSRIDDMATRILAGWYLLGQDSGFPATNFNSWTSGSGSHVNVQGNHASLIRDIGSASTVLLKNSKSVLPLNKPKTIALIGSAAAVNPSGANSCSDRGCNTGTLGVGWGSGTDDFPYLTDPVTAITAQAKIDGTTIRSSLSDTNTGAAASAASGASVALVFVTADSGEGYITVEGNAGDRNDLELWHSGAALVQAVAKANANTIVVLQTVGAVDLESFADNANVTAIVWSGLGAQEAGNSLTDILYGKVNPSGRLPFTIGRKITDYPAQVSTSQSIPYSEGLFIDYRWFDAKNISPRYEFGFGLSYSTFAYSSIAVAGAVGSYTPPSGPGSAVDANLHSNVFSVSFTVTNNGTLAGHEIPQLYISPPASANSPPYQLRGFDSVYLTPGQSTTVTFSLSRYDLSIWNVITQRWEIPSGTHGVTVGASSRDRRLTSSIVI